MLRHLHPFARGGWTTLFPPIKNPGIPARFPIGNVRCAA